MERTHNYFLVRTKLGYLRYKQLMSREAPRTTTKSKMALSATKYNRESLTFVIESPTPDSMIVLDTLRCFLKYVKITLNEMIKLYIK